MKLDVAVIIVSWNVQSYLADCLQSVYAEFSRARIMGAVWVVDNASTDDSVAMVQARCQGSIRRAGQASTYPSGWKDLHHRSQPASILR